MRLTTMAPADWRQYWSVVYGIVRWTAVGGVIGTGISVGLLAVFEPRGATDTIFLLGTIVLGFGTIAWSTAMGLGRTIEGLRDQLGVSSGWTEAGAREAFFVVWTGTGWVVAAALSSIALGV